MEGLKNINIRRVKNPLIVEPDEVIVIQCSNQDTLLDLRNHYFPQNLQCVVARNGELIPNDKLRLCFPVTGDYIIMAPEIFGGGDGDGKQILGMVLMIVVAVVAPYAAAAILGTTVTGLGIGGMLLAAGIAVAGGLLINALLPPPKPKIPTFDMGDFDVSRAYSWNPRLTQQAGIPIARLYGTHKIETGNVIASYIENINNKQYINILLNFGLGPYKRFYDFKINDQPYENFQGVEINTRLGNLDQDVIPNFNNTKSEYPMAIKIVKNSPYTYMTIGNAFDGLEVDVTFSQGLFYANDQGGLSTHSVDVKVEIRKQGDANWTPITKQTVQTQQKTYNGKWSAGKWLDEPLNTNWWEVLAGDTNPYSHYNGELYNDPSNGYNFFWRWIEEATVEVVTQAVDYVTISGAQTASIRRTFIADNLPVGQYEIKVSNLTDDQTSSRYGDDMYFTAVREVYYDDFEYPRQVLVSLKALASDQLSGSLNFSCMAEGAKVRIYDDVTQTWSVNITDNPAWLVFDALTKPVFDNNYNVLKYRGFNPSRLILQDFVDLADFCDELVPNGKGGQEKRCTFNGIFDSSQSTWSVVLQILQLARAVPVWNGINIGIAIDKKIGTGDLDNITQVFGMGDIIKDSFKESWMSASQRASVIQGDYLNAELDYKRDTATRINSNITSGNTIRLPLFGATKTSQVWREIDFRLEKNEKLNNIVRIDSGVEAIRCMIGDKIGISHEVPIWGYSGTVLDAATNTVTLDRDVTIESGKSYIILIQYQNDDIVTKTVANAPGTYSILQVSTPFTNIPEKYCSYVFGESNKYVKPFKVIGIAPHEDYKKRTLTLIEYNYSIYDKDFELPTVPTFNYSSLEALPSVSGLKLEETLIKAVDGTIHTNIDIYFNKPNSSVYTHAEIWYNKGAGWVYSGKASSEKYTLQDAEELMTYQVAVASVNVYGQKQIIQNAAQDSLYIFGKTAKPEDVTNFWGQASIGGLRLDWSAVSDIDINYYKLRYTSDTIGGTWNNAIDIAIAYTTSITLPAAQSGMYLIKAVDTSGNESLNATTLVTNIPSILDWNVQETFDEDPVFAGTKTDMFVENGELILGSAEMFDSDEMFDKNEDFDFGGGVAPVGYYETAVVNLGSIQTARCNSRVEFLGVNTMQLWDDDFDLVDSIEMVDGDVSAVGVIPQIALSQDGSAWGAWQNFFVGDYIAQAFKFRLKAYSNQTYQYLKVQDLQFNVDMPDRIETGQDVAIPAVGQTITFSKPYMAKPKIAITLQSAQTGDYYVLSNVTTTGFTIQIKDGSGIGVARTIDWESRGY